MGYIARSEGYIPWFSQGKNVLGTVVTLTLKEHVCRQLFEVQKTDFLGYELTPSLIFDLDTGAVSRKKLDLHHPKIRPSKIGVRQ